MSGSQISTWILARSTSLAQNLVSSQLLTGMGFLRRMKNDSAPIIQLSDRGILSGRDVAGTDSSPGIG